MIVLTKAIGMALLQVLINLLWLYKWIIIIRAIISWVNPDPYNPIVRALRAMTEPVLKPFRRLINPYWTGGIDFSPLLVLVIVWFFELFLRNIYSFILLGR